MVNFFADNLAPKRRRKKEDFLVTVASLTFLLECASSLPEGIIKQVKVVVTTVAGVKVS